MQMCKWEQSEEDDIESKWITVRPKQLSRDIPIRIVGAIYHTPNNNTVAGQYAMVHHIQTFLECILQEHPKAGIILAGDMNHLKTSALTSGFHLKQIVDVPTRGKNTLDKILTNMRNYYSNPFTIGTFGTSDHDVVVAVPSLSKDCQPPKKIIISNRTASYDQRCLVTDALRETEWNEMYSCVTPQKFEYLLLTSNAIIETYLPVKRKTGQSNDKPWITPAYRNLAARRQEAFEIGNKTKYKKLRDQSVRMSKSLKSTFYQRTVALMCGDRGRTWWKTVKTICVLNSKDKTLDCYANREYNGDTKQLAQGINNMFVSISKDLQPLLPMIYPNCEELPSDLIISVEDMEKQLMHTCLHKAIGPDQLPNWILKDMAGIIAAPMCHLFNSSLRDSCIPIIWKSANICPLRKTKPIQDISHDLWPPISLTLVLAKMLEQYPVNHMRETCQNVDSSQVGAVKGSSATFALLEILHPIHKATDDHQNYAESC